MVLVGLASKNAILIVEFARDRQQEGRVRCSAPLEACRLRLRPIIMTSFAFILGVLPLVIAEGPGPRCAARWARRSSRHARRDAVRHLPDAGVLLRCPVAQRTGETFGGVGLQDAPGRGWSTERPEGHKPDRTA